MNSSLARQIALDLATLPIEELRPLITRIGAELESHRAPALLTSQQAADYLGIPRRGIYDRVYRGRLKPLRDGSRLLFRWDELDAFLEGRDPLSDEGNRVAVALRNTKEP